MSDDARSLSEARAIAEDAYVYAYPMLMGYGFFYPQAIDTRSKMHQGMNRLHHFRQLGGPAFLNIIPWINNDTPYSAGWLDLRAEPFVLSLPRFPAHRFQDVQLIDLYTHNFAFFGTRVNGNEATNILIAGPDWQGQPPAGVEHVARAETRLVKIVTRILLEHPDDAAAIHALEDQYRLEPLSRFTGGPAPQAAAAIEFPVPFAPKLEARSAEFIRYLNFLLPLCRVPAGEQALFSRFAKIGIGAGRPFDPERLDPVLREAIDAGVAAAYRKIEAKAARLDDRVNGWEMPLDLRGNRARMASGRRLRSMRSGEWMPRKACTWWPTSMRMATPSTAPSIATRSASMGHHRFTRSGRSPCTTRRRGCWSSIPVLAMRCGTVTPACSGTKTVR